VHIPSAEA